MAKCTELPKKLIPNDIPSQIEKIIVLPDNDLYVVPFDVLLGKETSNTAFSDLPFLIKKYEISYLSGLGQSVSDPWIGKNDLAAALLP